MNRFLGLSALTALSILAVVVFSTPPTGTAAREPQPGKAGQSPFEFSAIGHLLRANANIVPASGEEFIRVLNEIADSAQLSVPFSSVSMSSGLMTPRVVISVRSGKEVKKPTEEGKLGFLGVKLPVAGKMSRLERQTRPLSAAAIDQPNLEGRLFFAANMERTDDNRIRVRNIEFISWNSRKKRFDFGLIEFTNAAAEIKLLDGVRCFSCHKNKGPILGSGPWSNTTNNEVVREATLVSMNLHEHKQEARGWNMQRMRMTQLAPNDATIALQTLTTFDGMSLALPEPEVVDAAVRAGSDFIRDRAIYRAMLKSADGRRALTHLLAAIVDPQPIEVTSQQTKQAVDLAFATNFTTFSKDVAVISSTSSSVLHDYSPAGSMGTLVTSAGKPAAWGRGSSAPANTVLQWSGNYGKVLDYNLRRAGGEPAMASAHLPSNTKAFVHEPVAAPTKPSHAVSPLTLARAIGLTEADRTFLSQTLIDLAQRINKPKVTAASLAQEVFSGPSFADNWKAGDIPDRDEFKERFIAGLISIAANYQLNGKVAPDRRDYTSGPSNMSVPGKEDREVEVVPTTSCLRCHDVRGVGNPAFNPIPMLAFDPFDKAGREAWLTRATAGQKQEVLSLLLKRLVTEKDMPPDDSLEHELFRVKDPSSFDAVRVFLDSELKKLSQK